MGGPLIASRWWQCISFDEDKLHLPAAVFAKPKPEPNTNDDDDDQRTACLCFGGEDRPIAFASESFKSALHICKASFGESTMQCSSYPVHLRSSACFATPDVGDDR